MPPGPSAVLRRQRQPLLERRRRTADHRHLRGGDLRQHLAPRVPRLRQGAVRAGEDVPQPQQPLLGVLPDLEHGLDLPPDLVQGPGRDVVALGVGTAAAGGRTARRRTPEGQRIGDHLGAQTGQLPGDLLQLVPGGVLPRPHPGRVRQRPRPLELRREQVDPRGQRRPDRVRRHHDVQRGGVQLVHPLHQLVEGELLGEPRRSAGREPDTARRCRHHHPAAQQPVRQLHQVVPAGPAVARPDLAQPGERVGVRVEEVPQPGDRLLRGDPAVPGDPGQLGPLQQPAARVVLEGEQRGLDRLVLRAEAGQRAIHLVPVHRPPRDLRAGPGGRFRDAHRSPLP